MSRVQVLVQHRMLVSINMLLHMWHIISSTAAAESAPFQIAKPHCQSDCGGVSIPYPFGINNRYYNNSEYCFLDKWFEIDCNKSTNYKPVLRHTQLEVLDISIDRGTLRVNNPITFFNCDGKQTRQPLNLTGTPFFYSANSFVAVISCDFPQVRSSDDRNSFGCTFPCAQTSKQAQQNTSCGTGFGCCQSSIPFPPNTITRKTIDVSGTLSESCSNYAFLVDEKWFANTTEWQGLDRVPVVLDWRLSIDSNLFTGHTTAAELIEGYLGKTKCHDNVTAPSCSVDPGLLWLQCSCPKGFEGNPYLLQCCQDLDECKAGIPNSCIDPNHPSRNKCENLHGGYRCYSNNSRVCEEYFYDYLKHPCNSRKIPTWIKIVLLGLGMYNGLLLLFVGPRWANKFVKKRIAIKRREALFKRNGGFLLKQQLSSGEANAEKIKVFKSEELKKSTDDFSIDRILGQGGQGTVYKGMLGDGKIVAIKRSKIFSEGKISEFINEVVILSRINHRNVVQLLGCCLETQVPLLVYEFVPNGTLSKYIHEDNEEFPLTWEMRLRIATEIAGALSYLHSAASVPIYHRDIKSTNILLDEKYRAKVADFGTSRSVAIDQTHLTTNVHGTFGYLDPEYFQSSHFTDKSDVYSFGVVLVELLTGRKPISEVTGSREEEYISLANYFTTSMQKDRLFDILDPRVVVEGSNAGIKVVANLAISCLNPNGRNRPTMREVTAELEGLMQMSTQGTSIDDQDNYAGGELANSVDDHWDIISSLSGSVSDDTPCSSLELEEISVATR